MRNVVISLTTVGFLVVSGFSTMSTLGATLVEKKAEKTHEVGFHDPEIKIIRAYFGKNGNLPPGLAKKDTLPPGLEKQLRERGTLPPGLERRMQHLPADLEIRLPRLPDRLLRVRIGVDVVLWDTIDNVIMDVIEDVVGQR